MANFCHFETLYIYFRICLEQVTNIRVDSFENESDGHYEDNAKQLGE